MNKRLDSLFENSFAILMPILVVVAALKHFFFPAFIMLVFWVCLYGEYFYNMFVRKVFCFFCASRCSFLGYDFTERSAYGCSTCNAIHALDGGEQSSRDNVIAKPSPKLVM